IVTSGPCDGDTSAVIKITVQPNIINNSISADQTICSGKVPAPLTASAPTGGSGSYTFQWESSTNGVAFAAINTNGTSSTYAPPALTTSTWYRRKVSGGPCATSISDTVKITINPLPAAPTA